METKLIQQYTAKVALLAITFIYFTPYLTVTHADGDGTYSVYDTNKDGFLDDKEFEKFYEKKRKRSKHLDIWVFDQVDSDGDKKISEQEMVDALMKEMKQKKIK